MNRRNFIAMASSMALPIRLSGFSLTAHNEQSPLLRPVLGTVPAYEGRVLVIIYLNGGNDGLNTVIPVDFYSKYYNLRSNIAIPESKILKLGSYPETGLHPSMPGLQNLFNEGKLGIVHSTSYPNPNQSHYRSTDIWMTGVDSDKYSQSGWAGRYLSSKFPGYPTGYPNSQMKDPLAIQIGYNNTTTLLGTNQPMNISLQDPTSFYQLLGTVEATSSSDLPFCDTGELIKHYREQEMLSVGYSQEIKTAADAGRNMVTYPSTVGVNNLGEQLKIVARLIHGGLSTKIYCVELRGFDTHASQVSTSSTIEGEHASLLKQLSEAIAAFQSDLKLQGIEDRVMGITFSDFGRRANSSASKGTDHGVAAPMLVFGSGIKRQMIGTNPNLDLDLVPITPSQYNNNQDIKMQIDFRRVYRDLLVDWLGASETTSSSILYKNFTTTSLFSDTVQSLGSGMWPDRAIWSTGRMPGPNDAVVINSGHTVSVGQDVTVKSVQVQGGGELSLLGNYKIITS